MTEDELTRLLRLKRYEKPSPEYFEKFLGEFQARQRAQLLREPAWRIAWDRFTAFLGEASAARYGYGLASAAVLVAAAITSFDIVENRPPDATAAVAQQDVIIHSAQPASFGLNSRIQLPDMTELARRTAHSATAASMQQPRYVMDTRPVSYEPPSSF